MNVGSPLSMRRGLPAPPPITTTLGRAPNEIEGIASEAVEAATRPVKARLEILDIMSSPYLKF